MPYLNYSCRIVFAVCLYAACCDCVAAETSQQEHKSLRDILAGADGTITSLLKHAEESDHALLDKAVQLAKSKVDPTPVVEALTKQLENKKPRVRALAAKALGLIGEPAKPAAKALAKLVADQDETVRRAAIRALGQIKPGQEMVVPLMQEALAHADPYVVAYATHNLAEVGPDIVPPMLKAMEDDSTIYYAMLVLAELGPDAKEAVPALTKALGHPNVEVRHEAAQALRAIGPDAKSAVPELIKALDDEFVQMPAALALGSIGPPASAALDALSKISDDSDDVLEICALWAISKIENDPDKSKTVTVPALVKFLVSDDQQVRRAAAMALLDLKPGPKVIAPLIAKVFADASDEAKADMVDAVATMGVEAVPRLVEALQYPAIRQQAVRILGEIGPDAAAAIPELLKHIGDEDPELRADLFTALGHMGSDNSEVITAAMQALDDEDEEVVISALYALGKSGKHANTCAAKVKQLLDGGNDRYQTICAWALVKVEPGNQEYQTAAVPLLIQALESEADAVRGEAVATLGSIGSAAQEAVAKLKEIAANDPNQGIQKAASEAINQIGQ